MDMFRILPTNEDQIAQDLKAIKRLIREARKYNNKRRWARAVMLRSTRIGLVLHAFQRVLGDNYKGREKMPDGRWAIFVYAVGYPALCVALVGGGSTKTLEEVQAPVPVEVLRPDLIDMDRLRAELVVKSKEHAA